MGRMTSKDSKILRSYDTAINNFENYCMEKKGKADFVSDLNYYDRIEFFCFD